MTDLEKELCFIKEELRAGDKGYNMSPELQNVHTALHKLINIVIKITNKEGGVSPPSKSLGKCPDCAVQPGQQHKDYCDIERCSVCGGQTLVCNCNEHDKDFAKWTGIWPGQAEADYLGIDLNQICTYDYIKIFFIKKPFNTEVI